MIRATAALSVMLMLILVFFIPTTQPPQRFVAQISIEHAAMAVFWGPEAANRILARTLGLRDTSTEISPVPSAADAPSPTRVNKAVAREMDAANQRLFNNAYFRSIDALLLLGSYRLATLLEWLPWLAVFALAALLDGAFVRLIKSQEFRQHDPEMFAGYASLAIAALCATVLGFVSPVTLHPLLPACAPLAISVLVGRALGCFHRRG